MRRLAACLVLACGCSHELDPYSWEYVTCSWDISSDPDAAYLEGLAEVVGIGAEIRYGGYAWPVNAQTMNRGHSCEITLFDGWDATLDDRAAVIWHELVHCLQPPWGSHYARETQALRQEMQVLRAIGWSEDELAGRAWRLLEWWGWDTEANVRVLVAECGEPRDTLLP